MSQIKKRMAPPRIIIITSLLALFLQGPHVALSLTALPNNSAPINNLFIFGYGTVTKTFISHATAAALPAVTTTPHNHHLLFNNIYVTSRSPPTTTTGVTSSQPPTIPTITILPFDDVTSVERALNSCTHILITVPPQTTTTLSSSLCPVLSRYYPHHHLISSKLQWIGYLSTTGVYGHHEGRWVDETSATIATTSSSSRSKAQSYISTEREWMNAMTTAVTTARDSGVISREHHLSLCVFRCAGLYCNERSALHTARRRGVGCVTEVGNKEECYTSRIHVLDVVRAIGGSMVLSSRKMSRNSLISSNDCGKTTEESGGVTVDIYNLADDKPEKRSVVMAYAKTILQPFLTGDNDSGKKSDNDGVVVTSSNNGVRRHRRQSKTLSERERRRQNENKRVSNTKMKDMLLLDGMLMYPTYREGLLSVFEMSDDFKGMRERR